jgi:small-conductance mechanosensitive channel
MYIEGCLSLGLLHDEHPNAARGLGLPIVPPRHADQHHEAGCRLRMQPVFLCAAALLETPRHARLPAQSVFFANPMAPLGIRLVGLNQDTVDKLLLTAALVAALIALTTVLRLLLRALPDGDRSARVRFWGRQAVSLAVAAAGIVGLAAIWFDNPKSMTTVLGLFSAGLAVALQKVVTSVAGYFLILRGNNFTVGDRIVMGGVRGNVIALGFFQTTIMEMGQPPAVQSADPAMWVKSRQFTGRIVTVANSRIFDEPIYNYTRDFPFIWEEISLPIAYRDDRARAEQALLESTRRHAVDPREIAPETLQHLKRRYDLDLEDLTPRVFWRLTDNWLEMTVRFVTHDRGTRGVKDAISRDVMAALDAAGIGIASATSEIVGLPPVRIEGTLPPAAAGPGTHGE